jgi:hypothetical protein
MRRRTGGAQRYPSRRPIIDPHRGDGVRERPAHPENPARAPSNGASPQIILKMFAAMPGPGSYSAREAGNVAPERGRRPGRRSRCLIQYCKFGRTDRQTRHKVSKVRDIWLADPTQSFRHRRPQPCPQRWGRFLRTLSPCLKSAKTAHKHAARIQHVARLRLGIGFCRMHRAVAPY